jgi:hypothetical protein
MSMTTTRASRAAAAAIGALRALRVEEAVRQPGERVVQREAPVHHRLRAGALHGQQRQREQRDERDGRVDGQDGQRGEAEQDALAGGLAVELAGDLVAHAGAAGERDHGRHGARVDREEHGRRDERADELRHAERAVRGPVGQELEDDAARRDGDRVLADVERPLHGALALEAVGDGARERLGEDGRGDAAEQEQGEHEGRGDDDVALVAPEPDGQHLAGHDGDGEDRDRHVDGAEDGRPAQGGQGHDERESERDDGGDVEPRGDVAAEKCGEGAGHGDGVGNERGRPLDRGRPRVGLKSPLAPRVDDGSPAGGRRHGRGVAGRRRSHVGLPAGYHLRAAPSDSTKTASIAAVMPTRYSLYFRLDFM